MAKKAKKSGKKSGGKKGKKSGKKSAKSAEQENGIDGEPPKTPPEPDMMDAAAMYNLQYIVHNAVQALEIRGFGPEGDGGGKKKKGKGGKKGGKKKKKK